jgi:hypothetical protein
MKGLTGVQLQKSSDNISCRRNFSINRKEDVSCHLKTQRSLRKIQKPAAALIEA